MSFPENGEFILLSKGCCCCFLIESPYFDCEFYQGFCLLLNMKMDEIKRVSVRAVRSILLETRISLISWVL